MFGKFPISEVAALLADPARVAMLTSLLDGESRPAGELARMANVSAQAASAHLAKLFAAQMLIKARLGRHHYYRLAKPEVGLALEALAVLKSPVKHSVVTQSAEVQALRFARTCYDHLAGRCAVEIADALLRKQLMDLRTNEFHFTRSGRKFLQSLGIDTVTLHTRRRAFARACIDWTERRYHVAGSVGAALLTVFRANDWVVRQRDTRAVRLTTSGRRELGKLLDVRFD
jgi:DNA-binding transcriptional ArsR family regulator